MKTKILSLCAMCVCALALNAQSLLVATLTHDETTTAYYGPKALIEACQNANHGDIINLSAGSFVGGTITKAVSIRGAGMKASSMTTIAGSISFEIPLNETTETVKLEGLYMPIGYSIYVKGYFDNTFICKCSLSKLSIKTNSNMENLYVVNSIFQGNGSYNYLDFRFNNATETTNCCIDVSDFTSPISATFVNCFMQVPTGCIKSNQTAHCINCIVGCYYDNGTVDNNNNSSIYTSFDNCILFNPLSGYTGYVPGVVTRNSILIDGLTWNKSSNSYIYNKGQNCLENMTYEQVFKTFEGRYSFDEDYTLTDSIATAFLGSDGTQVGIYGGSAPFSKELSYPQITKMDVADKATDGTLRIDIEISSPIQPEENENNE